MLCQKQIYRYNPIQSVFWVIEPIKLYIIVHKTNWMLFGSMEKFKKFLKQLVRYY